MADDMPRLEEATLEDLWRFRQEWKDTEDHAHTRRRAADQELLRRAADGEQQIFSTPWGDVTITYASAYGYNTAVIDAELFPLVERDGLAAEYNQFVRHNYKIDRRWVNRLMKRGPEWRDVIERMTESTRGSPSIDGPTLEAMGGYAPEAEREEFVV